jgi:hypothetical protein
MTEFAGLTGLAPVGPAPRRYLWTDAFGVCNFLGLHRETGDDTLKDLCLRLIGQVHHVLGRHRPDDGRAGWISGLDEQAGERHPTAGGLRIGKSLAERKHDEPLDERLEWDRDGQYYHYLTKWMHALNLVSTSTGDFTYNRWAVELARTASARFVYAPRHVGHKAMHWKMSIDLSYPLVPTMGHHDPLDGLITYTQLQTAADNDPEAVKYDLKAEIAVMAGMCAGRNWATDDPLGLGGLLSDAFRVGQLMARDCFSDGELLVTLLDASRRGLEAFAGENTLRLPAPYRLAFRELGLSIGLKAMGGLERLIGRSPNRFVRAPGLKARVKALMPYRPLGEAIDDFWILPEHQETDTWMDHREINMVMLATSLLPDGYLTLSPASPGGSPVP